MARWTGNQIRHRIHARIRKRLSGTGDRPRLAVFRSNKHIYAQLIDDAKGVTIAAAGSIEAAAKKSSDMTKVPAFRGLAINPSMPSSSARPAQYSLDLAVTMMRRQWESSFLARSSLHSSRPSSSAITRSISTQSGRCATISEMAWDPAGFDATSWSTRARLECQYRLFLYHLRR